MEENGQRQWNQQHQLALGTTLLVVCSPVRVFVCRWVSHVEHARSPRSMAEHRRSGGKHLHRDRARGRERRAIGGLVFVSGNASATYATHNT